MKTKRKKNPRARLRALLATPSVVETTPAHDCALKLILPCKYELLGYYRVLGNVLLNTNELLGKYALVKLDDGDNPARFATYEIRDAEGHCILGHYFGEFEYSEAVEDFQRRTRIGSATPKKAAKPLTERQAWQQSVVERFAAQQKKVKDK